MSDLKCNEIRDVFQSGQVPADAALEAHMRSCKRCGILLARDGQLGLSLGGLPRAGSSDLSALKLTVLRNARAEVGLRATLRARSSRQRLVLVVAAMLLMMGLSVLGSERLDPRNTAPLLLWAPTAVYLAGIFLGSLELIADPARPVQHARRSRIALALGSLPALAALWTESVLEHQAGTLDRTAKPAIACFLFGSFFTVALLVWLWLLDRNERLSPSAIPLAATSAGVFGTLAVHLHCAGTEPVHLLLGHLALVPAWVLVLVTAARWRRGRSFVHDRHDER